MKIAIIGYRNHSKKLLNLCLGIKDFSEIIVYCYNHKNLKKLELEKKSNKIIYTSNLDDLNSIKAVFISSPNNTHVEYIKFFLKKNIYIFCEKPPCTNNKDYNFLINLHKKSKKKFFLIIIFKYQI